MLKKLPLAFLFLMICICAEASPFKDCGSKSKVAAVTIPNCPASAEDCPLIKGTNASISVQFKAGEITKKLTASVHGIIKGIPVPFTPPNTDGCTGCGIDCPVKNGSTYTYKANIPVQKLYPAMRLVVKWELLDDNGKDLFCIMIPCEIKS